LSAFEAPQKWTPALDRISHPLAALPLTASAPFWLHCPLQHQPFPGCTALVSISHPLSALPLTASAIPCLRCA
ncbi:hypothetical protein CLOM_g16640, partial [Closterium sp. NIES-68]